MTTDQLAELEPIGQLGLWHAVDPSTSREAALDNFPRAGNQASMILEAMAAAPERDWTFVELTIELGMYSAQKRLSDLKRGGWVKTNGERRATTTGSLAECYVLSDAAWTVMVGGGFR